VTCRQTVQTEDSTNHAVNFPLFSAVLVPNPGPESLNRFEILYLIKNKTRLQNHFEILRLRLYLNE